MSIAVSAIPTPYIHSSIKRRKNTWYSQKDGNWSDPTVWESNASKRWSYPGQNIPTPIFPQVGDDVYINNAVTLDISTVSSPMIVNNVRVSGSLVFGNSTVLQINGDLQATGTVNMTGTNSIMYLYGVNNSISTFVSGASGTVNYSRSGDQDIMNVSYRHLATYNSGTKNVTGTLSISGNLTTNNTSVLEKYSYNMSVAGTTIMNQTSAISSSGTGSIIFGGLVTVFNTNTIGIIFNGNPNVEVRSGLSFSNNAGLNLGSGQWKFTTNNQSISSAGAGTIYFPAQIVIDNITLTTNGGYVSGIAARIILGVNPTGTTSGSELLNQNWLELRDNPATVMPVGQFDFTTYPSNTLMYSYAGNYTLPSSNYGALYLNSAGINTLSANTVLTGILYIANGTTLDLSTYNFTAFGGFKITASFIGLLKKTSAGTVIFTDTLDFANQIIKLACLNFSGNPSVEIRNGIITVNVNDTIINTGSGQWKFTTNNNQNIVVQGGASNITILDVLIDNGILVNATALGFPLIQIGSITFGVINGSNAGSTLKISDANVHFQDTAAPMLTGTLNAANTNSTVFYDRSGNQDIKGGTYNNLTLGGSGIKTLQGNVVYTGTYLLTGTASLNLNGYTLT